MLIEIKNYTKKIRGATILEQINLCLESGNIYGFIGRNGSGKTMLLRAIAGLIRPTEGKIVIDQQIILHKDCAFPPKMGLLLEKPNFLDYLTGFENLKLLAEINHKITDEQIYTFMNMFHLDSNSTKHFKKYSQGMKQKVGIIQALMETPELIILDEPFNTLDEESVQILRDLLLTYREEGKLILLTSHNKEDIETTCNIVSSISSGKIVS